jgi:hypothetical protein
VNERICQLCLSRPTICCAVNSYKYTLADQSCCSVGFMTPDLLSAPDKVALPGLSLAFPFEEPLLLPIKIVLVNFFRYCSSERAAFRNSRKSLRWVLGTRRYQARLHLRHVISERAITSPSSTYSLTSASHNRDSFGRSKHELG